ncbi:MAG: complex I NDUFA9 subunit family protein [Limnobacter sp.]|nr:complex I NDUFA9 subunit family protein [Limnobacter sp.]
MTGILNVLVLGGSGFIGEAVCNQLAQAGCRITVPTRRYDKAKHLLTLPTCRIVKADIHDRAALSRLVDGQDAVVNLVGILHSTRAKPYGKTFRQNHVDLPKALCAVMSRQKVRRVIHISALGVGTQNPAPSMYLRSKTDGEAAIKDSGLQWTILRPSVVFGPKDQFLNTFAGLSHLLPVIPLAGANTRFQPVAVADVAKAVRICVEDGSKATVHTTYDLVGLEIFTLRELVTLAANAAGKHPKILPLPDAIAKVLAFFMECLPGTPLINRDNVDSLKTDNVHAGGKLFPLDKYLSLSATAPAYIQNRYQHSDLDKFRQEAHRRQKN